MLALLLIHITLLNDNNFLEMFHMLLLVDWLGAFGLGSYDDLRGGDYSPHSNNSMTFLKAPMIPSYPL